MFPNRKVHGYTHIVVFVPIHTDGVRVNVDVYNPQERKVNQDMNGFSISKLIRFRSNDYPISILFNIKSIYYYQVTVALPRWISGAFSYTVIDNAGAWSQDGQIYHNMSLKGK